MVDTQKKSLLEASHHVFCVVSKICYSLPRCRIPDRYRQYCEPTMAMACILVKLSNYLLNESWTIASIAT